MGMTNSIVVRAIEKIDTGEAVTQEGHVNVPLALEMTLRDIHGSKMDDAKFVTGLLIDGYSGALRRHMATTEYDPDVNEDTQMELPLPFPKPGFVSVATDDGGEDWVLGRFATLEQVRLHVQRTVRSTKAKAKRAINQHDKVEALAKEAVDSGDNPVVIGYVEAVSRHGRSALARVLESAGE